MTIVHLQAPATEDLLRFCRDVMSPCLCLGGGEVLGWYVTEDTPNDFPRLPVREGEHVLVGLAAFDDAVAHQAFVDSGAWDREIAPDLGRRNVRAVETLRLVPTARSATGHA